ncbi:MAG: hypothetical protein ACRD1T_08225 [Acidimicrobiia bacterium]
MGAEQARVHSNFMKQIALTLLNSFLNYRWYAAPNWGQEKSVAADPNPVTAALYPRYKFRPLDPRNR